MLIFGQRTRSASLPRPLSSSMRIVNDIAERGVALVVEYNKLPTNNEDQKLLDVKEYRQRYPDRNKRD